MRNMLLGIKRIYEKNSITDGKRILVDRLWPRGVRKDSALIDEWIKDVAPSDKLRKWFGHNPKRWREFKRRYIKELKNNPAFKKLLKEAQESDITLIYSAKDEKHNNAVVLAELIKRQESKKNIKINK